MRDEAVRMALDKLLEVVKKYPMKTDIANTGTGGDNARYGAVCITSEGLHLNYNCHPCHAFMKDYRKPIVIYNQYGHRSFINERADRAYFDWITSDYGPWKDFVGRRVTAMPKTYMPEYQNEEEIKSFIWNNGWVWSDLGNHPSNLQHNFLVAARMGTEWPKFIDRWFSWVEDGCHPGMAFVFLDVFRQVSGDTRKWQVNNQNKYDWPIDVCTSSENYIKNFCLGRVEKLNKSYAVSQKYDPVNRIFGENNLSSADDKGYPNRVFELYHDEYGPDKEKCDKYWSKKGTGFSKFNYRTHWWVTEAEIVRIIKEEEKRLLGA